MIRKPECIFRHGRQFAAAWNTGVSAQESSVTDQLLRAVQQKVGSPILRSHNYANFDGFAESRISERHVARRLDPLDSVYRPGLATLTGKWVRVS